MLAAVKLDDDSEIVKDNGMVMREVTVQEESDHCTLVVDLTINTEDVKAIVDSGAQVSVLSKGFYDSLCNKTLIVEKIRLKGASASGVMIASQKDDVCVGICAVKNHQAVNRMRQSSACRQRTRSQPRKENITPANCDLMVSLLRLLLDGMQLEHIYHGSSHQRL